MTNPKYYDVRAFDKHIAVGGTTSAQLGFVACALVSADYFDESYRFDGAGE